MDSSSEKSDEKRQIGHNLFNVEEVDVAARLDSETPLDPKVAERLRYATLVWNLWSDMASYAHSLDGKSTGTLCPSCVVSYQPSASQTPSHRKFSPAVMYLYVFAERTHPPLPNVNTMRTTTQNDLRRQDDSWPVRCFGNHVSS